MILAVAAVQVEVVRLGEGVVILDCPPWSV